MLKTVAERMWARKRKLSKVQKEFAPPGPDAGPLGPEAGWSKFVERLWTQEVESEFTPSLLNQPLPPAILTSVVPLSSTSQLPVIHASTSLPAVRCPFQVSLWIPWLRRT